MTQLADLAVNAPTHQENLHRKIVAARNPAGSVLSKGLVSFQQLTGDLEEAAASATPAGAPRSRRNGRSTSPLRVEVIKTHASLADSVGYLGASLLKGLGILATVLIFASFMLFERVDVRNRFLQLLGTGNLTVLTSALNDAAQGISRYLVTQLIVNVAFGGWTLSDRCTERVFLGSTSVGAPFYSLRRTIPGWSVSVHAFSCRFRGMGKTSSDLGLVCNCGSHHFYPH
jgi:predicted PurR-regulated permease PerM